jgi:outer membrane protein assembly factor BamB
MKFSLLFRRRFAPLSIVAALGLSLAPTHARDWPQWRGPDRNGHSDEKGLLKEWPAGGPKLLWKITDAGSGYSTPAVVGDRIYALGNDGLENEFVAAFAVKDGKRVWTTRLGNVGNPNQKPPYPGARSTPTVDGDILYALGSDGDLACVEIGSGKVHWRKNLRTDFGGKPGDWAYSESPLIDGERLICTPGGADATLVALNKKTGDVIWKCALPEKDDAAFASAIVVEAAREKQYVQLLQKGLVGVEAKSGKLLWRFTNAVSRYGANIPSPVAGEGYVYVGSAGTGGGAVRLTAKDGGVEAEKAYFESKLPTAIGGAIKIGEHLYGTTAQALLCVEFKTGEVKWEDRALGAASLCYADGRLYLHGENGAVALVEPSAEAYREKGRFTPPDRPKPTNPSEKAWAYPVVSHGKLYVREQGTLWCYDVR